MKFNKVITVIIFFISFSRCRLFDYESQKIKSPSNKFYLIASVNKTNKAANNYADVFLKLYSNNNILIDTLNTKAGDFNKWAVGWDKTKDTIILFSSDIGNNAWSIQKNKLVEVKIDNHINQRAIELKIEKYKD